MRLVPDSSRTALTTGRLVVMAGAAFAILTHYWVLATIGLATTVVADMLYGSLTQPRHQPSRASLLYDNAVDALVVELTAMCLVLIGKWPLWLLLVQTVWLLALQLVRRYDRNSRWFWMHRHGYYLLPASHLLLTLASLMVLTWQWVPDLSHFVGMGLIYVVVPFFMISVGGWRVVMRLLAGPYPEV